MQIENRLRNDLSKRLNDNNLRALSTNQGIDFFSNDYLGLAQNKALHRLISEQNNLYPFNGATGSRLLSGNSQLCEDVESKLTTYLNAESCLIFNSGYTANLALLSAVARRGDTIIYDELAHACIKDGARLTLAERYSFKHNDLEDLQSKLSKASGQIFIVVESVYSMDGDEAPLKEIVAIAQKHNAEIIVDEAHATGLYGAHGGGLTEALNLSNDIFARVYTFGKAMGNHGAAVAGSKVLKDFLINFARPFIYTTALPPHSLVAIEQAFRYLSQHIELQNESEKKVLFFNTLFESKLSRSFTKIESKHPIQSIIIPGNDKVKELSNKIIEAGFDIRPILSPTVKSGSERLRICLHTFNSNDEIVGLIDTLASQK